MNTVAKTDDRRTVMQTVRVTGNLDVARVNATREMLLCHLAHSDGIEIDMSDVYRIDSAGLAGLVEVLQAARVSGRCFRLKHVRTGVMRVIRFSRLDRLFCDGERIAQFPSEGCA